MGVAAHLTIDLDEYDAKIRTFVPHYETMLEVVAETLAAAAGRQARVLDLGIGTGALARRCLERAPGIRLWGIDADAGMLRQAEARLAPYRRRVTLARGNFTRTPLPAAEAVVASLALHHVRTRAAKVRLYRRIAATLRPGGFLLTADAMPGASPRMARRTRAAWEAHMARFHARADVQRYLRAWAGEDVYFPLATELAMMRSAGLAPDVVWRCEGFAVVLGMA
ncbi:MAG: class I SAM-dependent methyltransferase [Acidobacteriota bacterium]